MTIEQTIIAQRNFFNRGLTKNLAFRVNALKKLGIEIRRRKKDICRALHKDLGKAPMESHMAEIGITLDELRYILRNLPAWAADTAVKTPLMHFPSRSFVQHEPYGLTLVISPWNYPFLLSIVPLIGAICAGNCVVLKPSNYSPATSTIIREILSACFHPEFVSVIEGGRKENTKLLEQKFDFIFFTGSVNVGKLVMEKAAHNLTPVCLELGGKSPCIVDETANIEIAARRIAFGKFLNAGQTCVAPDYLFVHEAVKQPLLKAIRKATIEFFGNDALSCPELPRIVNEHHYQRLLGLIEGEDVYFGGFGNGALRISPTVLNNVQPSSPVMQDEIFGPILPVMSFTDIAQPIEYISSHEKPLALYLFTTRASTERRVLNECSFGGGCINDTIVHLATSEMGFGGVGQSGMGSYHGKKSFETFSHSKGILKKSNSLDLPIRYHPYKKWKQAIINILMP